VSYNSDDLAISNQLPEVFLNGFLTQFILPFLRCFCESLLLGFVPVNQDHVEAGRNWE
jgi:hypothetical protein